MDRLIVDRLSEIEATIAELEKLREAEDKREQRILSEVAGVYGGREKIGLAPAEALLKKLRLGPADTEEFFKSQEEEARRWVSTATPQLQLNKEELEFIERQNRAILVINPCVPHSPGWICAFHAYDCNFNPSTTPSTTGDASATCTCNTPNNECNPRVEAYGRGSKGRRSADLHSYCYFYIPARPNPANVYVKSRVDVHGFWVLRRNAGFSLDLEMRGFQYNVEWGTDIQSVLSKSGATLGRYDGHRVLQFHMEVGGGDPFYVRVSAKLHAWARSGGAEAVGDFGMGNGNFIKRLYVNTED